MPSILRILNTSAINIDGRPDTDPQQPSVSIQNIYKEFLTYGTGINQVNTVWWETRTVNAGSNDDLDLTALTKSTPAGTATVAFTCIKGIQIETVDSVTGDYLLVGKVSSVTNGWEGPFRTVTGCLQSVEHEGCYSNFQKSAAGWTVDSTHKVLRINNPGATAIQYRITLEGEA